MSNILQLKILYSNYLHVYIIEFFLQTFQDNTLEATHILCVTYIFACTYVHGLAMLWHC